MPIREIIALVVSSFVLLACSPDSKIDPVHKPAPGGSEDGDEGASDDAAVSGKPDDGAPADSGKPSAGRDAGKPTPSDAGGSLQRVDASAPSEPDAGSLGSDAGAISEPPPAATGSQFPAVTDAWARGPFEIATGGRAGPARNANLAYPKDVFERHSL
ncbi:MAG: hypothetical protein RLZZ450_5556 [Pseudomonadota bacterium]|jgi:hypothetical protein